MKDIKNPVTLIGVDDLGNKKNLVMDADYVLKFLAENYPDRYMKHVTQSMMLNDLRLNR